MHLRCGGRTLLAATPRAPDRKESAPLRKPIVILLALVALMMVAATAYALEKPTVVTPREGDSLASGCRRLCTFPQARRQSPGIPLTDEKIGTDG